MSEAHASQSDIIAPSDKTAAPSSIRNAIDERRSALLRECANCYEKPASLMGIAFSGGGIRSATLSLGIAQAFAKRKRLLDFDYCSTVSGGGYFGSFMTALFMPDSIRGNAPRSAPDPRLPQDSPLKTANFALDVLSDDAQKETIEDPFMGNGARIRHPIWWLRQHSRYMAPNGPSDYQAAITYLIRNWTGLIFVIVAALAMIFATSTGLTTMIYAFSPPSADWFSYQHHPSTHGFRWSVSPLAVIPVGGYGLCVILAQTYWQTIWIQRASTHLFFLIGKPEHPHRSLVNINFALLAFALGALAYALSPWNGWTTAADIVAATTQMKWAFALVFGMMAASAIALLLMVLTVPRAFVPVNNPDKYQDDGQGKRPDGIEPLIVEVRRRVTRLLSVLMFCSTIGLLLALLGALGRAAYCVIEGPQWYKLPGLLVLAPLAATFVAKAPQWFANKTVVAWLGNQVWNIALVVAIVLYSLLAIAVDVGVQMLAFTGPEWTQTAYWKRIPENYWSHWWLHPSAMLWTWLGVTAIFVITGSFPAFLNLSSLHGLYGTRLTRAFLGATNLTRLRSASGVTDSDPGDQIRMSPYQSAAIHNQTYAPFHLVNTTLNETVSPTQSQLLERDRKGVPLVFAPEGVLLAATDKNAEVIGWGELKNSKAEVEELDVGQLCAISGAAFSSGMGMKTTLGGSLLLVFANIRLGYWWHVSDALMKRVKFSMSRTWIKSWMRRWLFPTYTHLILEMCGRYYRRGNYVNLSDGDISKTPGLMSYLGEGSQRLSYATMERITATHSRIWKTFFARPGSTWV